MSGGWQGIEYFYASSPANQLSHVVVEYAGDNIADTTRTGNIVMLCTASSPSRLNIDNSMLNFGIGWGLYASANGCEVNLGANVTYTSNAVGGFNLMP